MTAVPTVPLNIAVNQVERVSGGGGTCTIIRLGWMQPQNFDQFDIDRYDITVTATSEVQSMTTACGQCTSTVISVCENPNNVRMNTTFSATIAAVNLCRETGPTGTASYTLSKLLFLSLPSTWMHKVVLSNCFCLPVFLSVILPVHKLKITSRG